MNTTILIPTLISALSVFVILFLIYKVKYNKLNKKINSVIKELTTPIRRGFYQMNCNQSNILQKTLKYEPVVYVDEIERYSNGLSKIKLAYVEISCGNPHFNLNSANDFVKKEFKSLIKTSDVVWLETEISIKEKRKEKLQRIEELFNKIK